MLTALGPDDHRAGGELLRSAGRPLRRGRAAASRTARATRSRRVRPARCAPAPATSCASTGSEPEETAEAFRGGWYHTGDAGYLDERGYLYLVDRVKDMIVTGGENVYSVEVENALASHPAVAEVAVIGIPARRLGRGGPRHRRAQRRGRPRPRTSSARTPASAIAGYKVPKSVEFRAEPLPLSGALKVLKRELRAPYWEGRDRGVN